MSKGLRLVIGVALIIVGVLYYPPLIAIGASLALGAILERMPGALKRLQEQSVLIRSAVAPQEILYGRTRKGGVVVYFDTSGTENEFLWFVIAVVEHEIDSYETLWIDNVAIDISTEINGSDMVTKSDFVDADGNNLVKAVFYTGAAAQTADADLVAAFGDWTTSHNGNGVAYFWVRLELDKSEGGSDPDNPAANVWNKGWPRDISVTAKGAKVYDPRLDSTNGGSGPHRVDTYSTWEWSENSVLCRTDYLRSSRFGPGYTSSEVTWATVIAQADIADVLVDIPDAGTQKRYTINGVVTVDNTPRSIVGSMQSADHGITLFLASGIEVKVGAWEASSHTIDDTWLSGPFSATSSVPTDDAYNAVRGQFLSADDDYSLIEFEPRTASAYETEDGTGRMWEDILLPFTTEEYRAQRLAIIELKKSRQQTTAQIQCNFRADIVEAHQVITLDLPGYSSVTFRVIGKSAIPSGATVLQLREEVSTDWDYTVPDLAVPPVVPTIPHNPDGAPPPTNLAAATSAGILLTWTAPAMANISHIELYASATNDRSTATLITKTLSESYLHDVADGVVRYYWVISRAKNGLLSTWEPTNATGGVEGTAGAAGVAGLSVFVANIYKRSATAPATPYGGGVSFLLLETGDKLILEDGTGNLLLELDAGQYDFGSHVLTPPSGGWSVTPPAGSDPLYVSTGSFSVVGQTGIDTTTTWTSPDLLVTDGQSIHVANIYKRSAAPPSTPTEDDGQYDFSTNTLTPPAGWSVAPPAGADPLYVSTGSFSVVGTTDIDTTVVWTSPDLLVQDGDTGVAGADGADGSAGVDARGVNLTIADQTIEYDTNGANPDPTTAILTATAVNTTGTVYYEFFLNDASQQNTTSNTWTYTAPAAYSSMPQKLEVQIREGSNTGTILARDQLTVSGLQAGTDAITIIVNNEAHTLPTTNTGTVTYTGSGTDIEVWEGTTQLPYGTGTPGFTIAAAGTNITVGGASTVATYTRRFADHSSMTADNASIEYTVTVKNAAGVTSEFTKLQTFAKSTAGADGVDGADGADGSAGVDARGVNLIIADQTIEYDTNGANPSPSSATLTATAVNTTGTVYYEFFKNDSSVQNTTANSYAYSAPAAYSSMPEKLEVQIREGANTGPILARDQLTVSGLRAGTNAITIIVDNEAHTLPTTNTGTVTYTGSGTDIDVWEGTSKVPYGAGTPGFTISAAGTSITPGSASTVATYTRRFADHGSMTADNAFIEYTVTVKNAAGVETAFTKLQTFAKSIEGADGPTGATGPTGPGGDDAINSRYPTVYKLNDSAMTDDTAGNFNNPLSGMEAGWGYSVPTLVADGDKVYASSRIFTSDGAAPQQAAWSTPAVYAERTDGIDGDDAINSRYPTVYKLNDSAMTDDTAGTYADPLSGMEAGWGYSVPALVDDGDQVYVSSRIFTEDGNSPQQATWSTPAIYAERADGAGFVPDFTPGHIGGSSNFVFTLNAVVGGGADDGEIRIQGTTFEHPDGTTITLAASDINLNTRYESSVAGRFFIMYSASVAETRFGGTTGLWGAGSDTRFCCVTYDDANGWRARDNNGTYYSFTPLVTDCIIARCDKIATSGGIETIIILMGGLGGPAGADGFTVALSNPSAGISADSDGNVVSAGLAATDTIMTVLEGTTSLDFTNSTLTAGEFRITGYTYSPSGFAHGTLTGVGTSEAIFADIGSWSNTSAVVGYMDIEYWIKPLDNSASIGPFKIRQTFTITRGGAPPEQDVDLFGGYFLDIGIGHDGVAGWLMYADGTERKQIGTTITQINTWLNSGNATDYELLATLIDGINPDVGTMGSWQGLGAGSLIWRNTQVSNGGKTTSMSVKIRHKITLRVYDTAPVTLWALREP